MGDKTDSEGRGGRSGDGFHRKDRLTSDMREISRKLSKLRRSGSSTPRGVVTPPSPEKPALPAIRTEDLRRRARSGERPGGAVPAIECPAPGASTSLEEAAPGEEVVTALGTTAYVIRTPICSRGADNAAVAEDLCGAMGDDECRLGKDLGRLIGRERAACEDLLFVDLETTGLQSTPLFLIGAMTWEEGDLVVRQFFARHYGEEAAVIAAFLEQARSRSLLLSFNGKSYDWPYVRMRAAATGVSFDLDPAHVDLLHESRRIWSGVVPDCRLQTLEQHVLGQPPRRGDIPGKDIPDAYHRFVRSGDATQMAAVLEHNLLDLVALAELLVLVWV